MQIKLKSIGAVLAGLLSATILSTITDMAMVFMGVFQPGPIFSTSIIILLLTYRTVYNAIGFYVTGRLAPFKPTLHMQVLLGIGITLGLLGTYLARDLGPLWYGLGIVVLSVPAFFGAKYLLEK